MKQTIIKIIYDNCKVCPELQEDWGFSALIEMEDRKILFDTGNDPKIFFSNLEKMNIRLEEITDVVFSHKHKDHIAGCKEILEKLPENSRVYLPKGFPLRKIPKENLQIKIVTDFLEIDKDLSSISLKGGFFWQEQSLIVQTEKGLVIVTGCAHPGIINIIEAAMKGLNKPVYLLLGGFHLFRKSCRFVDEIVHKVKSLQVENVAPCHCSGQHAILQFQKAYGNNFYMVGVGTTISI